MIGEYRGSHIQKHQLLFPLQHGNWHGKAMTQVLIGVSVACPAILNSSCLRLPGNLHKRRAWQRVMNINLNAGSNRKALISDLT